jgi:iron complex transport system ATP-binding protein
MAERVALEVRALSVRLGTRPVLKGVSLDAHFGEVMAILGPNGAGKSTLLRAVCGLVEATGEVRLDGEPLWQLDPFARATRLSFVPQHSQLAAAMPVYKVVAQGRFAHHHGLARMQQSDHDAIRAALEESDTLELSERSFTELSFGEQKRVMIARALATGARTLLLDEPTASLDVEHALRLFALLRTLAAQGRCIVTVLHQLDEARNYSDRSALIKAGELVAAGPSRDIISPERVRSLYNVEMIVGGGLGFRLPEPSP